MTREEFSCIGLNFAVNTQEKGNECPQIHVEWQLKYDPPVSLAVPLPVNWVLLLLNCQKDVGARWVGQQPSSLARVFVPANCKYFAPSSADGRSRQGERTLGRRMPTQENMQYIIDPLLMPNLSANRDANAWQKHAQCKRREEENDDRWLEGAN